MKNVCIDFENNWNLYFPCLSRVPCLLGMALLKGDCSLRMLKGKMTPLKVEDMDRESVVLSFAIPIVNTGRQIGTIMDAFVRTYLPFEQYDKASVTATLTAADTPRDDGYWQALSWKFGNRKCF